MPAVKHLGIVCLALGSALTLAACDEGYGYGDVAVGYGPASYDAYYDGYASPYYGDPGYGYGYYGWYGGYYYPGSGIYVYDRYRRPLRWNGDQRRYWQGRLDGYRGAPGGVGRGFRGNPNWNGFNRGTGTGSGVAPPAGQAFRGATPGGGGGRGFGGGPGRGGRGR